jgi:hypothetical protein
MSDGKTEDESFKENLTDQSSSALDSDVLRSLADIIDQKKGPKNPRASAWGRFHTGQRHLAHALAEAIARAEDLLSHDINKRKNIESLLQQMKDFQTQAGLVPKEPELDPNLDLFAMLDSAKETTERIFAEMNSPETQERMRQFIEKYRSGGFDDLDDDDDEPPFKS